MGLIPAALPRRLWPVGHAQAAPLGVIATLLSANCKQLSVVHARYTQASEGKL